MPVCVFAYVVNEVKDHHQFVTKPQIQTKRKGRGGGDNSTHQHEC